MSDYYLSEIARINEENRRLTAENTKLRETLNACAGALTYYTEVDYDASSDVQAGYGIEVLDEIEEALQVDSQEQEG